MLLKNKILISLCLITILSYSYVLAQINEIDLVLESIKDKRKRDIFPVFHSLHKKKYDIQSVEGEKRYKIFKANMKWIKEKNASLGKQVYGITPFMDLTDEEFKNHYLMKESEMDKFIGDMKNNNSNSDLNKFESDFNLGDAMLGATPNFDWRYLYEGNPCKDQKTCGSCWSFASNAAIEGNYKLNFGKSVNLSVQYLVDCDLNDTGCSGGWPTRTFKWIMENGVLPEKYSAYQEARTLCQFGKYNKNRLNLVKDFNYCESQDASKTCSRELWIGLLSKGPIVVAMDAQFEGFSKYKPGPDFEPAVPNVCGKLNHAVLAVGLVTEKGEDFLLVRNSWGPNWGKDGYFKISTKNHCGILDNAWYPIVHDNPPFPEKKCADFYSQKNYSGNKVSSCTGENDFMSSIGGKLMSFEKKTDKNIYFNFFTEKDCKGETIWNYDSKLSNLDDNYAFKGKVIKSASVDTIDLSWGCMQHFTKPCYTGDVTLICSSIPDFSKTDFKFTTGSMMVMTYSIENVFFFEDIKYQGKGFGIKGKNLKNFSEDAELFNIMQNAKSMFISIRDPNSPYDPDW